MLRAFTYLLDVNEEGLQRPVLVKNVEAEVPALRGIEGTLWWVRSSSSFKLVKQIIGQGEDFEVFLNTRRSDALGEDDGLFQRISGSSSSI